MSAYNPQSFVSVTLSFTVCLGTHEISHDYFYFCFTYIYIYTILHLYLCLYLASEYLYIYISWNLYILNRFHKLWKWLIAFHAIWGLCRYIVFGSLRNQMQNCGFLRNPGEIQMNLRFCVILLLNRVFSFEAMDKKLEGKATGPWHPDTWIKVVYRFNIQSIPTMQSVACTIASKT